jgi:predicted nuclease with RNAse H fold
MTAAKSVICGVDFGAQRSGNTVVAVKTGSTTTLHRSAKGQETDPWIVELLTELKPALVAIDAPLSLPGIYLTPREYSEHKYTDYFYRACDRELQAMSPMFLGGLTARAMRLKDILARMNVEVIETYPKKIRASGIKVNIDKAKDAHEEDALFCLALAELYHQKKARGVGSANEGLIWLPG